MTDVVRTSKYCGYDLAWIERVKARCVITESGCWLWQGFLHPWKNQKPGQPGYPGGTYRGKPCRVHRKMLEVKLGTEKLPTAIHACHTCDTPNCVNPDHLYAATNSQNHLDGSKKKRMQGQTKTHCKWGHEYTPENTYVDQRPGGGGSRHCRICTRLRMQSTRYRQSSIEAGRRRRARLKEAKQQENGNVG